MNSAPINIVSLAFSLATKQYRTLNDPKAFGWKVRLMSVKESGKLTVGKRKTEAHLLMAFLE